MGLPEEAAREQAEKDGYKDKLAVVKTSFKANSKASTRALHAAAHAPCSQLLAAPAAWSTLSVKACLASGQYRHWPRNRGCSD